MLREGKRHAACSWSAWLVVGMLCASCDSPTGQWDPQYLHEPPPSGEFVCADSVQDLIGTRNVKLALNVRVGGVQQLYYVDYNEAEMPVRHRPRRPAGKDEYHMDSPLLSPDGKWVTYYLFYGNSFEAYFQKLDTVSEPVLLASPGADPHWWQNPADTSQMYIIYVTDGSPIQGLSGGATIKQRVSLSGNGSLLGQPDTIIDSIFKGGMSRDGDFLCTGYMPAYMLRLSSHTLYPVNGGLQTCNPSISPDPAHPDRMMFLNFQGMQNMVGAPSGVVAQHAFIFIVDAANTMQWSYQVPAGTEQWQDPEWSNHPDFLACLARVTDVQWDGYIVRISDGRRLRFTDPSKLSLNATSTPYVWIGQ